MTYISTRTSSGPWKISNLSRGSRPCVLWSSSTLSVDRALSVPTYLVLSVFLLGSTVEAHTQKVFCKIE